MLDTDQLADAPLKFADQRSVIRQPLSFQNIIDTSKKRLTISHIGTADMQFAVKCRRAAENGKIVDSRL